MRKYIILLAVLFSANLNAQDTFNDVLKAVFTNNTTIKASLEKAKADKIGNRTGINMENPEVEFGYLWGSPSGEGHRIDLSVTQSFDFPTAYRYKSQLATGKNKQVDLVYEQECFNVMQQVRLLCVELVYQQKQNKQLTERLQQAKLLSDAYQKRFDQGDIDILERNKTRLNYLTAEKALQMNKVNLELLNAELKRMNGGQDIIIGNLEYPDYAFPVNFPEWYNKAEYRNPSLRIAEQEVELSRKQEQLTRALNFPKLSTGYTSERVSGTTFQGISVGVSIPLWEGKNTVKHQKAQTVALQFQQEDAKMQFQNTLKSQYDKASKLSVLLAEYSDMLETTSNESLLKKALEKGQLSLINYLLELEVYYDTMDKYLETERDYQLAVAEMQQWEMMLVWNSDN